TWRARRRSSLPSVRPNARGRADLSDTLSVTRRSAMFDKFNEECAIFGIAGHHEAANLAYLGLYAMQHRGQESAGIASADGHRVIVSKDMGYVADIFDSARLSS